VLELEKKKPWVAAKERSAAIERINEFTTWLDKSVEKQEKLEPHVVAAFTSKQVSPARTKSTQHKPNRPIDEPTRNPAATLNEPKCALLFTERRAKCAWCEFDGSF
jgi:hypothetical protein